MGAGEMGHDESCVRQLLGTRSEISSWRHYQKIQDVRKLTGTMLGYSLVHWSVGTFSEKV